MIRIERPPNAPEVLQDRGETENRVNCESHDNRSGEYRSGSMKFEFKKSIYAHDSVKNALEKSQHCKCCYCESKYRATSPGAVEHFRPKGAVQQERSEKEEYPGYYWLAYRWKNLLVTCTSCNTSKGALFPLSDPEARARSHRDEMDAECPLLVDPASEDPRQHIRFRGPAIEPLTERGRKTIRVLKLNRSALEDARGERLVYLDCLRIIAGLKGRVAAKEVEQARNHLEGAVLPDAEYSSMARCLLEADNAWDDS